MKSKSFGICLILACSLTALTLPAQPVARLESGGWLTSWLLLGPIPLQATEHAELSGLHFPGYTEDYLTTLGGEGNLRVKDGDQVSLKQGVLTWKGFQSPDSLIDLVAAISDIAPALAYAYAEVEAEAGGIWLAGLGTNDGGSLWINGAMVWDHQPARGFKVDSDLIPVYLQKGKNRILLKIEQHGNRWEFGMRFLPFSAEKALSGGILADVHCLADGSCSLVSGLAENVRSVILNSVSLEVTDFKGDVLLREQRGADFTGLLDLPAGGYAPYRINLDFHLLSGKTLSRQIPFYGGKRTEYSLFGEGKSEYRIVLPAGASESEKWAATGLQEAVREMSGILLPVVQDDAEHAGPGIYVGYNRQISRLPGITKPAPDDESFCYFNSGKDIFIFGGEQRGTMYGVMTFMEKELGIRWYTRSVTVIPKRDVYTFSSFGHREAPGIRVRNNFYFEAFDPVWAARNKMNGVLSFSDHPPEQPGGVQGYWAVHTFYPLMPPEEFYGSHPEYYSLINGRRIHERAQLCLSNPDVLRIITERILDRMDRSPDFLIYDVSQNDWHNPCQCDPCQAIASKYGGESGIMIWFVNQVAEAVEKRFPDKFIGTLAYQYTRSAPENIRPRNNVVVRLCSIECCFAHEFESCHQNASFLSDLQNWASMAPHLYIWDYVVNFSHYVMPYPNFRVLQSNIKTFRDNHAIGIMEQAAYQSRGGELAELRAYLLAKLLWDPECDTESVINDFMYGYYGRSGKYIREYFDLLQNQVTPETHLHLGLSPHDQIFTDDFVRESLKLFAMAETVADNPEILRRVEMASLPVLYLKCKRTPKMALQDGSYERFCRVAEREGITHYAESGEIHRKAFHYEVENEATLSGHHSFLSDPAPDYSKPEFWAASPRIHDPSDSIPQFLADEVRDRRADVFFIHPTSFFPDKEGAWNASLTDKEVNQTTDYRSILFQASVFNGSCRVFAPRYRQAAMKTFYVMGTPEADRAFDLAYDDIRKAFQYYLNHENRGRPIVIASHSQGSLHAIRLLQEFFDGTSLQKQLVCAYIVGYRIEREAFKHIPAGERFDQTGCFVGWRTYATGEFPKGIERENGNSVCVNPLTWKTDPAPAPKELHQGIMFGFETLVPGTVSAVIDPGTGILWVDTNVVLEERQGKLKNYHTYDYNLFWMNIRENVKHRIDAFLKH